MLTTQWRRNIKDPNAAMLDLPATLPDGRLEVEVQLQDHDIVKPSMVRRKIIIAVVSLTAPDHC